MLLVQALLIEERSRLQLCAEELWRELAATCDDKDKLAEALEVQTHVLESLGAYARAHARTHTYGHEWRAKVLDLVFDVIFCY